MALKCFFEPWKFDFFQGTDDFVFLWGYSLDFYCAPEKVYFLYTETPIGHAEFETSFFETLGDKRFEVFDHLLKGVAGCTNTINIECTLVDVDEWIEVKTVDKERLSPFANVQYAKGQFAKVNARKPIDCWSAI